jgi:NAD-dependent dihydropyrimidine dehydrogenase PreA subunit
MKRRIIRIDEEKCIGCGACAEACHEGAIQMVNGKARLMREDYCDGLGDCLPACPAEAITFEEREAPAYDPEAVRKAKEEKACGCAGSQPKALEPEACTCAGDMPSQLRQWPVQIKLAPVSAPFFDGADLLVAADCTAYAYGAFHRDFIRGKAVLVGCTKLDGADYSEKLTEIFRRNDIRSITVARMEVPCCGGMEYAVKRAIEESGKDIPLKVVTISIEGEILD